MRGAFLPLLFGATVALSAAAVVSAASSGAAAVELYGRPLLGLTPAPLSEVVANPAKFKDRILRIEATGQGGGASLRISSGAASLPLRGEGFELPKELNGARLAAEGRLRGEGAELAFVATGLEVKR